MTPLLRPKNRQEFVLYLLFVLNKEKEKVCKEDEKGTEWVQEDCENKKFHYTFITCRIYIYIFFSDYNISLLLTHDTLATV